MRPDLVLVCLLPPHRACMVFTCSMCPHGDALLLYALVASCSVDRPRLPFERVDRPRLSGERAPPPFERVRPLLFRRLLLGGAWLPLSILRPRSARLMRSPACLAHLPLPLRSGAGPLVTASPLHPAPLRGVAPPPHPLRSLLCCLQTYWGSARLEVVTERVPRLQTRQQTR